MRLAFFHVPSQPSKFSPRWQVLYCSPHGETGRGPSTKNLPSASPWWLGLPAAAGCASPCNWFLVVVGVLLLFAHQVLSLTFPLSLHPAASPPRCDRQAKGDHSTQIFSSPSPPLPAKSQATRAPPIAAPRIVRPRYAHASRPVLSLNPVLLCRGCAVSVARRAAARFVSFPG
jgi:hypothetical protein